MIWDNATFLSNSWQIYSPQDCEFPAIARSKNKYCLARSDSPKQLLFLQIFLRTADLRMTPIPAIALYYARLFESMELHILVFSRAIAPLSRVFFLNSE